MRSAFVEVVLFHVQKAESVVKHMLGLDAEQLVRDRARLNVKFAEVSCSFVPNRVYGVRNVEIVVLARNHRHWAQILNWKQHAHLFVGVAYEKPHSVEVINLNFCVDFLEDFV